MPGVPPVTVTVGSGEGATVIGFTSVRFECTGDRKLEEAVEVAATVKRKSPGTVDVSVKDERGGPCVVVLSWPSAAVPLEMFAELWRDVGAGGGG